jgi:hypothetical protein
MAFFGEERVLAAYQKHAPDFVILVDRGEEYGVGPFGGASWGGQLVAWVRSDYELLVDEGEARSRLRLWGRIDQ